MDVNEIVTRLRAEGNDSEEVEAKLAHGGLPGGLPTVISAFANRPGGGVIVLGVEETAGFASRGVYDPRKAQQALAHIARTQVDPPVTLVTEAVSFEDAILVLAWVHEAERSAKPIRLLSDGRAYIRQYDGTYPISDTEEQIFVAARGPQEADIRPVDAATMDDLDRRGLEAFAKERRASSSVFSTWSDEAIWRHTYVATDSGVPTVGGLMAFGIYPQQFLPNTGVQVTSWSGRAKAPSSILLDSQEIVGPIPAILEDVVRWVGQMTPTAIVPSSQTGHLVDHSRYPSLAIRELVANALVHRDYGPHSLTGMVTVTIEPDQFIITNPGGLYGVTVEELGRSDSSLRNPRLAAMLLSTRTRSGQRVIERLGSGIPRAVEALASAGMPTPRFHDTGIRFTARLLGKPVDGPRPVPLARSTQASILGILERQPSTIAEISSITGLSRRQADYAVKKLLDNGRVEALPDKKGQSALYRSTDS